MLCKLLIDSDGHVCVYNEAGDNLQLRMLQCEASNIVTKTELGYMNEGLKLIKEVYNA